MITKSYILKELKKLKTLFDEATKSGNTDLQKFYSKLALLEFCGWIEQSMDGVVVRVKKKLRNAQNINEVDEIIRNNYSFKYTNFRIMLTKTFGIIKIERIEKKFDINKKILLESSLSNLKLMRDEHAHTYIHGATLRLYAPSWTIGHFDNIYNGLKEIDCLIENN